MRFFVILAALLAGCATQKDPTLVSDWDICRYTMDGGNNAVVAQNEASRRGVDCRQLYPAILAKRQQDARALQDAANYFNRPAPAIAPSPAMTCRSYVLGGVVQTDCR